MRMRVPNLQHRIVFVLLLTVATGTGCSGTLSVPEGPDESVSRRSGIATLSQVFSDYRLGITRPGRQECTTAPNSPGNIHYVESLEYVGSPPVSFGLNDGCIVEIRTETGHFDHTVSLTRQRLGMPDGEDRATCSSSGQTLITVFWNQPEGRFEVTKAGTESPTEYVLRSADTEITYGRVCNGGVVRDEN